MTFGKANSAAFGKVAVLLGGTSAEREISLLSGKTVYQGLLEAGVDALCFDPQEKPLHLLSELKVDRVFNVLHGRGGEDGTVQGALEFMNLPYTGSGVLGSALAMDKVRCKWLFEAHGLPTADFKVITKDSYQPGKEEFILAHFDYSVFVKPANEGSSIGMSHAKTQTQLSEAIISALEYDDEVLIEAFIDGPEYTVAILADKALPVIELRTPRSFYDYEAKYHSTSTEYICPCDLNDADTTKIQQLALAAFSATGASGWGRVDLMRDAQGEFKLLEVNTVPGMTAKSLVPMAASASGLSLNQLLLEILKTSYQETN